jgi:hypothetical protein
MNKLLCTENGADALTDVLWGLSYLSSFDDDHEMIEYVMSTGVTPTLVKLLNNPSFKINPLPLVRVIGNFIAGSTEHAQTVIGTPGFMEGIKLVLATKSHSLRRETCWIISNIAAGTREQITLLLTQSILKQVIEFATDGHWEIRKNACWALVNICTAESRSHHINRLIHSGGLKPIVSILSLENADVSLLCAALDSVKYICQASNEFVSMVYEYGGTDKMEALQEHSSQDVYLKSVEIIETFYSAEDDEEENLLPEVNDSGMFGFVSPKQLFQGPSGNTPQCKFDFAGNSMYQK